MSKKYEDLSKEELLKKISEFEQELKNKKYGLVWEAEKFPEQVVLECENNLPVLEEVKEKEIKNNNLETKNLLSNEKSNPVDINPVDINPVDINPVETRHCLVSTNNIQNNDYNILIEGDNYHALTVLNYTHENKIDVIYIDPPYNTGNKDFIYNDNFVDKEDSYRHSKWLNFMEKRLKLAKNLLKEDGVIFISIDDNEQAQLKLLCDKIFGEENFVGSFIWHKKYGGGNDNKNAITEHEYIFCYGRNLLDKQLINDLELDFDDISKYQIDEKGQYYIATESILMRGPNSTPDKRPNLCYGIKSPDGEEILPRDGFGTWCYQKTTLYEKIDNGELIWKKVNGKWMLFKKQFLYTNENDIRGKKTRSILNLRYNIGQTGEGKTILKDIFGNDIFSYPKPVSLIKHLLKIATKSNSFIVDFMAGSGTTGHAVLELNKEDSGNRKFILCTNNQNNICEEVTYKRLEKVMNGYNKNGDGEFIDGLGGNLKYFKTSLVKKSKSRSQLKIDITQKCTEMLCLKESIFDEVIKKENYKIFSNIKNDKYLAIYYNFLGDDFGDFIEELKEIRDKCRDKKFFVSTEIIVYVFSVDNSVDKSLFKGLDVKLEAIPQKILEVYKSLMKI